MHAHAVQRLHRSMDNVAQATLKSSSKLKLSKPANAVPFLGTLRVRNSGQRASILSFTSLGYKNYVIIIISSYSYQDYLCAGFIRDVKLEIGI